MARKRCGTFHDSPIIRNIVGRLHVGTPEDEVLEYAKSRLKKGFWETKMTPQERRDFECEVKRAHRENLDLYLAVARGRF